MANPFQRTAPLWDGSLIELGEAVRLRFRRPHPLSATARLEFVSRHRTQPSTDAVLLMAESCILGPASVQPRRHARLARSKWCCSAREANWDAARMRNYWSTAQKRHGRSTLRPRCRVEGEEFAFSLEPVADG